MRRSRCPSLRAIALLALLAAPSCGAVALDTASLAELPPLPASVLVTGGAFVSPPPLSVGLPDATPSAMGRTFASDPAEALEFGDLLGALRAGRVFVRLAEDDVDTVQRARLAARRGALSALDPDAAAALARARREGHDYVLVVQRLQDGPVEEYGINDRWPLTVTLWLAVGLGMVIPDRTFESRANLQAVLYEAHDGREVHRVVSSGGPVDLSLVNRASVWGLLQSVIVPPFWVGNDEERVVGQVRETVADRIVDALARQLKGSACRQDLADHAGVAFSVERSTAGLEVAVRSRDALSLVAVQIDGEALPPAAQRDFGERFLAAETEDEGSLVYRAVLEPASRGRLIRVLVRRVDGRVASATMEMP